MIFVSKDIQVQVDGAPAPRVDALNSTATPLAAGATFLGAASLTDHPTAMLVVQTDQTATAWVEFSLDGVNWSQYPNSTGFKINPGVNEVHVPVKGIRYHRLRITNTSASPMSYLRAQLALGDFPELVSPLNSIVQADADAKTVRALDFNLWVAQGLYEGYTNTIKDGYIKDVDTGTVPEDISNELNGPYQGFPTGAPQPGEVIVTGADTGTLFYFYMAAPTDTDYLFGTLAISGAGTYALGHNVWRNNFMYFISNNPATSNVGEITLRNTITTTNIFSKIDPGIGQSYCSAYTVPANSAVHLDRITGSIRGSATGSIDGYFYYRDSVAGGHRLRFPFELQFGTLYFDDIDYLIRIPAGVDFIPRLTEASTNNLGAKISYRIIKVKS